MRKLDDILTGEVSKVTSNISTSGIVTTSAMLNEVAKAIENYGVLALTVLSRQNWRDQVYLFGICNVFICIYTLEGDCVSLSPACHSRCTGICW